MRLVDSGRLIVNPSQQRPNDARRVAIPGRRFIGFDAGPSKSTPRPDALMPPPPCVMAVRFASKRVVEVE